MDSIERGQQERMVVRQRADWTPEEIAAHALQATSLSQLTLPEVKALAAWVLREDGSPEPNATVPKASRTVVERPAGPVAFDRR